MRPKARLLSAIVGFVLFLICAAAPALAQSVNNPSGLPLPRFVSTRSEPINVRVGPGTRYDVAWVYVKAGQPVEIVQEFDTWRKIRDVEGAEGWVHQNLLSNRRTGYITPLMAGAQTPLRKSKAEDAAPRAMMEPGLPITIEACDGDWCSVRVEAAPELGRARYSGFVRQSELWGVYPNETFD